MLKTNPKPVRLNIYLHDLEIRRQIKTRSAQEDISISEFCQRAITEYLDSEKEIFPSGKPTPLLKAAKKARQFQSKNFPDKIFRISSADLIRESRKNRVR